ncbi:carotenoid oxygenase family protein [Nonomuraea sp. NPDC050663]|uniref:carotenoid oxygenase family protein n=1 Tax=Nonomuraea sp. NPDC050663 TaxID=3364370 RepID=UPI0037878A33
MNAYLEGHLAPVPDEISAVDLTVEGTLPEELSGRYFRNGPNPRPGEDPGHWFTGHGMIHGVRIRDGRAEWYRNRWVRTNLFTDGAAFLTDKGFDRSAVQANTHVIHHADKILALVEVGLPYELDRELNTVGACDFGGRLTTSGMTAHPKELDGELHFFGYGFGPPYLTYHRLDAKGELVESRVIDVPGPTMMHDFAVTENYVIWLDLPVVFDFDKIGRTMPYSWNDSYGARLGVMKRTGEVTWFDVDPCYVFHVGNAREDASGRVVLDGVRYTPESFNSTWEQIGGERNPAAHLVGASLHRWTLDLATGRATERQLDDRAVEFPTFNEDRLGRSSRYLYAVTEGEVVKYDIESGASLAAPVGGHAGEAVFVPAFDARAEDDGWLMSIVDDRLLVQEAAGLETVATVRLPRRVPAGFHGSWIAD